MKLTPFTTTAAGRRGFTLPELLIVITIIALVAGLLVAGAMKFQDAQKDGTTDAQLTRLQLKLRTDYQDVLQKCQKDQPPAELIQYCGSVERARVVHTAATLRTNFPETFAEATTGFAIGGYQYPAKKTFASIAGVNPIPGGESAAQREEREQSERAVLLLLITTERSVAGSGGDDSGMTGERRVVNVRGKEFTVFIDLYGRPIVYYRWAQMPGGELDAAPYTSASARAVPALDPLDPTNQVPSWGASADTVINTLNAPPLNLKLAKSAAQAHNRVPTVVSAGRDKKFDPNFQGDDRVGFRLERVGATGKKGDD